jgi:hypothetical protein
MFGSSVLPDLLETRNIAADIDAGFEVPDLRGQSSQYVQLG